MTFVLCIKIWTVVILMLACYTAASPHVVYNTTGTHASLNRMLLDTKKKRTPKRQKGNKYKFERCKQLPQRDNDRVLNLAAATRREPISEVFWLHIPKCGTSFLNTLIHFACPSIPPEVHVGCTERDDLDKILDITEWNEMRISSLMVDETVDDACEVKFLERPVKHAVLLDSYIPKTMLLFRTPKKRLISAFEYNMLKTLLVPEERRQELIALQHESKQKKEPTWKQLQIYHDFPGITGCQTKMVLGYNCCDYNVTLTEADLAVAIERTKQFAFIGLTDEYDRSIALFHAKFGGYMFDVEVLNSRPGKFEKGTTRKKDHYSQYQDANIDDYYDDKLFEAVQKQVQDDFKKYKIPKH